MSLFYIEDENHNLKRVDSIQWAKWFETADRTVKNTKLSDCEISTVFLGADHNFRGGGDPIVYETLVFGGQLDGEMYRYATRKEAEKGHMKMVKKCKVLKSN